MTELASLLDKLVETSPPPDDPSGRRTFDELDTLRLLRNVVDHMILCYTAQLDRLNVAERAGSTTKKLLIEMGFPPSMASRVMRVLAGWGQLDQLIGHAAEGRLSVEVVDAVVGGIALIEKRSPEGSPTLTGPDSSPSSSVRLCRERRPPRSRPAPDGSATKSPSPWTRAFRHPTIDR